MPVSGHARRASWLCSIYSLTDAFRRPRSLSSVMTAFPLERMKNPYGLSPWRKSAFPVEVENRRSAHRKAASRCFGANELSAVTHQHLRGSEKTPAQPWTRGPLLYPSATFLSPIRTPPFWMAATLALGSSSPMSARSGWRPLLDSEVPLRDGFWQQGLCLPFAPAAERMRDHQFCDRSLP